MRNFRWVFPSLRHCVFSTSLQSLVHIFIPNASPIISEIVTSRALPASASFFSFARFRRMASCQTGYFKLRAFASQYLGHIWIGSPRVVCFSLNCFFLRPCWQKFRNRFANFSTGQQVFWYSHCSQGIIKVHPPIKFWHLSRHVASISYHQTT